jgi:hypothetical protein
MRLFTTVHERDDQRSSHHHGEQALREILSGPDSAHRRELETMLEDRTR